MSYFKEYVSEILKSSGKFLSVLGATAVIGCASVSDKTHNVMDTKKRDSSVYQMEATDFDNLSRHQFDNLLKKAEPTPQCYENAFGPYLKSLGFNDRQLDAIDGEVGETSPTRRDVIASTYPFAGLLPYMTFSDSTAFVPTSSIIAENDAGDLEKILDSGNENAYTGGSVTFTKDGAVSIPQSNGPLFNAVKKGQEKRLLDRLEDFNYDHSVQYDILQEGEKVGDLTIYGSKEGNITRPEMEVSSNAFKVGFASYNIDDLAESGLDVYNFSHEMHDRAKARYLPALLFAVPAGVVNPYIGGGVAVMNLLETSKLNDVIEYSKHTTFNPPRQKGQENIRSYMNPHDGNLSVIYPVKNDGSVDALAVFNLRNPVSEVQLDPNGIYFGQPQELNKIMLGNVFRGALGFLGAKAYENRGTDTDIKYIEKEPTEPTGGGGRTGGGSFPGVESITGGSAGPGSSLGGSR